MSLPSGNVTFLFTDIEGSTRLWEQHPEAMRVALARHDALLHEAIESHQGTVIKTIGDAFCAVFARAVEATQAALVAQRMLEQEDWGAIRQMRVRMALHSGVADERGGDYYGPPLNRIARLLAIGHGGQVLLSEAIQTQIGADLPESVSLRDQGVHQLRDLQQPEHVWQLLHPELPADFPPLRSLDVLRNNLPLQTTSFIGRDKELADVRALLGRTRMLTLTGSGGTGKSRLSLQVAADHLEEESDGVWLVELAPLSDPTLVVQTVAAVLSVREEAGTPLLRTLADALKPKKLLLILDNCEHLLSAAALLADTLLKACPQVTILASSREGLGVSGEQTYRIPSLELPPAPGTAHALPPDARAAFRFDSVRLFADRAALVKADFLLTDANAPAVASLCYRLDGIPLALELAAARVRAMAVEQIEARLNDRFRLLIGGSRTALPRQQTLRALIDWSYDLLNETEQKMLCRLAVFTGGWTLEAAEEVCGDDTIEAWEVLDLLTALVDKSLVVYEEHQDQSRYRLLETVKQYARERLMESGQSEAGYLRHRDYFLDLAQTAKAHITGSEQGYWFQKLESEHDNLRAALDFCQSSPEGAEPGLKMGSALQEFWWTHSHLREGRERLKALLARPEAQAPTLARAGALNGAGVLAFFQGDYVEAKPLYAQSMALYRERKYARGIANAGNNLGNILLVQGDTAAAQAVYEEALVSYQELNDRAGMMHAVCNLGNVAYMQSDYEAAHPLYTQGLALAREVGNTQGIGNMLFNLGSLAHMQQDNATAKPLFEEALTMMRQQGNKTGMASALSTLATIAVERADDPAAHAFTKEGLTLCLEIRSLYEGLANLTACALLARNRQHWLPATQIYGATEALRANAGISSSPKEQEHIDHALTELASQVSPTSYATAFAAGQAMDFEAALSYALQYISREKG
ncbi:MAG: hypothetical protein JWN14_1343 [Chthonomonadales bacterium]|nr:hypothetical protein [Chthonomonadales bacterium]